MSASAPPADHSLEIAQMEQQAAREERARQEAAAEKRRQELATLRSNAGTAGRASVGNYLGEMGLDAGQYTGQIDQFINDLLSSVAPDDPNPGSYIRSAGQGFYDQQSNAYRAKTQRTLNSIFAPNFETQRAPYTLDDPTIGAIDAEQRGSADDIIRNMLNRRVITQTGYDAAKRDLDRQGSGVRSRLGELGQGLIAEQQGKLRGKANEARSSASGLNLGDPFDPYSYGGEVDTMLTDWIKQLPDSLRGLVSGNMYKTEGLGAIAGAASGAQNTVFDPRALAGIVESPDNDNEDTPAKRKSEVF